MTLTREGNIPLLRVNFKVYDFLERVKLFSNGPKRGKETGSKAAAPLDVFLILERL